MILRELIAKFGFDVDDTQVQKIDQTIEKTSKSMTAMGQKATQVGKSLTTFVTLPILGLGAAMIKTASDAEETESKFNTVFSGIGAKANETSKNLAQNFGLSSTKAQQLLGDTGDLLTGFGFAQDSALDLSKGVQELAVDLASFTNFSGGAEGASQALTKALLGERESIKSLGISILEEDVKKRVALNTTKGLTFETQRQAKAYATLQLAQEQSKNAIGDFARTNQGFANRLRILGNRIQDVAVAFGKILLPPALKLLNVVIEIVEFFGELSDSTKTLILVIGGLAAVVGPLLLLLGGILTLAGTLTTSFVGLAGALGLTNTGLLLLIGKFILIGAAIAAAFAIVFLVIDDLIAYFRGEGSLTGVIIEEIGKAVDFVGDKFNSLPGIVQAVIGAILTPVRLAISTVRTLGGVLGALSGGDFSGALDAIKEGVANVFDPSKVLGNGLSGLFGFGDDPDSQARAAQANLGSIVGASAPIPAGAGSNVNQTANAEVTVNVPAGTDPEAAGEFVRQGVSDGLFDIFQDTQRQVASPIAE